jgi:DNA replication protein DnaC
MKRLRDAIPIPAVCIRFLSKDPAMKTWTCPTCGPVPPMTLPGGWYLRRKCRCEQHAEEQRFSAVQRQELARARVTLTYTWLGAAWSEVALAHKTFATFRRERQPQAFDLARAFAQAPRGVLALHGSYGTGKTHLLAAIANQLGEQGTTCLFASAVTLFDAIQDRLSQGQDYLGLIRRGVTTPLLLLDDVDKLKPSEFREEMLYRLINGRANAGLPLAISSNSTPNELGRWIGEAGRSRLMMGLIPVPMYGTDYRPEMRS